MSNDKYTCCECDADMTEAVRAACREQGPVPLVMGEIKEAADTVMIQCPSGHWCEYICPKEK